MSPADYPENPEHSGNSIPPQPPVEETPPPPQIIPIHFPAQKPVVTYILIGLTVFVFILQMASEIAWGGDYMAYFLMKINAGIYIGQFWRLFTPMLVHGGVLHIAFNMYALYSIGSGLELYYGHKRYLLLYMLGGFCGNVASFLMTQANSLGASTAVFALVAAEGIFVYKNRNLFGQRARSILANIVMVAAVNLVLGLQPGIDNWGHLGGLLGGLAFAWFGGPILIPRRDVDGIYFDNQHGMSTAWMSAACVFVVFSILVVIKLFIAGVL